MVRKGRVDRRVAADLYHQAVETAQSLHPETDPEKLFFMRYGVALVYCPDGEVPCHVCLQENHRDPRYVDLKKIEEHQKERHPHARITCERCSVKFLCAGDAGKHTHYVHVRPSGWWNAAT